MIFLLFHILRFGNYILHVCLYCSGVKCSFTRKQSKSASNTCAHEILFALMIRVSNIRCDYANWYESACVGMCFICSFAQIHSFFFIWSWSLLVMVFELNCIETMELFSFIWSLFFDGFLSLTFMVPFLNFVRIWIEMILLICSKWDW